MTVRYVAKDPRTGVHLRDATADEIASYIARNAGKAPFDKPVRIGPVLIDTYTEPGGSHVPGRFLT